MKKERIKIVVIAAFVASIVISLSVNANPKFTGTSLTLKNVEALTKSESGSSYAPCVRAHGYCIIKGVQISGIAFID